MFTPVIDWKIRNILNSEPLNTSPNRSNEIFNEFASTIEANSIFVFGSKSAAGTGEAFFISETQEPANDYNAERYSIYMAYKIIKELSVDTYTIATDSMCDLSSKKKSYQP